jgi:hypothetical protein
MSEMLAVSGSLLIATVLHRTMLFQKRFMLSDAWSTVVLVVRTLTVEMARVL